MFVKILISVSDPPLVSKSPSASFGDLRKSFHPKSDKANDARGYGYPLKARDDRWIILPVPRAGRVGIILGWKSTQMKASFREGEKVAKGSTYPFFLSLHFSFFSLSYFVYFVAFGCAVVDERISVRENGEIAVIVPKICRICTPFESKQSKAKQTPEMR